MKNTVVPKKRSIFVRNFAQIEDEVRDLHEYLIKYKCPSGNKEKIFYAIHHSQVSPEPFNFFVVNPSILGAPNGQIVVVINPKIISKDRDSRRSSREGCMSFPFRPDTQVYRYDKIKVEYQIPDPKGEKLLTKTEEVVGLMAHIFQHEIEHSQGRHIYL